jgi:hypothetical protein
MNKSARLGKRAGGRLRYGAALSALVTVAISQAQELPPIHNSPDTECEVGRQCSAAEFDKQMRELKRQWPMTPPEIRAACATNYTLPSMWGCVIRQTLTYLNEHPGEPAPWLPGSVLK